MSWLSGAIKGATLAKTGYNQGEAIHRQSEQEARALAIKEALEQAAEKRNQANADARLGIERERFDFEKGKKTPQERISARVSELVGQGIPLIQASRQARLEAGETNPVQFGSPEYVQGAADVTRAREAAKGPRATRGSASDPNSPVKASQRERYLSQIADRAIQAAGGDVNKAGEVLLQDPTTANIFSEGMGASHMNAAAARYMFKGLGRGAAILRERQQARAPVSRGALTDLVAPPATKAPRPAPRVQTSGPSQQQRDWDEAAAALRQRGDMHPEVTLRGPRPLR